MINYKELYKSSVKGLKNGGGNQVTGHCPFHDDKKRSWSGKRYNPAI